MANPIDRFVDVAPPIDDVRADAARCADETARYSRGERGPLRMTDSPLTSEFSGEAAGTAAEVALVVAKSLKASGAKFDAALCWSTAATLLRNGWQRGHKLVGYVTNKGDAS